MTTHDNIHPIRVEPPAAPLPTPPGRMHGAAITLMALCALVGIIAVLLLATVRWTESTRSVVIATIVIAGIGFVVFSGIAVLVAGRDTYRHRSDGEDTPRG